MVCCHCPGTNTDPPSIVLPWRGPADIIQDTAPYISLLGWASVESRQINGEKKQKKEARVFIPKLILDQCLFLIFSFALMPSGLGMITFPVLIAQDTVLSLISLDPHV